MGKEESEKKTTFQELGLIPELIEATEKLGKSSSQSTVAGYNLIFLRMRRLYYSAISQYSFHLFTIIFRIHSSNSNSGTEYSNRIERKRYHRTSPNGKRKGSTLEIVNS